ncbi:hypothetical protein RRG08_030263 [Elysia crispata]|uniref:Uncharacterized protein n=1 Tax=Elysia crispata TaxID=231223 RepID=A0AAE1AFV1_9GAST|nr:hypothetical protein RRG08_030263 [Elysia crispata]
MRPGCRNTRKPCICSPGSASSPSLIACSACPRRAATEQKPFRVSFANALARDTFPKETHFSVLQQHECPLALSIFRLIQLAYNVRTASDPYGPTMWSISVIDHRKCTPSPDCVLCPQRHVGESQLLALGYQPH